MHCMQASSQQAVDDKPCNHVAVQHNPDSDSCRQEGHVLTSNVGLDITLPAACITRQLALWYHLQNNFRSTGLYTSPQMFQDVVDVKEAVRLMVAPPLAQQLGVQAEREGDLRVMLAYLHPASSPETDFVFMNGGGGKGRGYKRKRGQPKVIYAGALPFTTASDFFGHSKDPYMQCKKCCATVHVLD